MRRTRETTTGFALPTVMIASIVMLMVLLSGLVSASSTNAAIRSQYQDKVLAQAVQSGVAMANACMSKSNQIVTWSDVSPLRPNTDCNGTVITAAPVPSPYVLDATGLKTTFEVKAPVNTDGTQRAVIIGRLIMSRSAGTSQERTSTGSALVGGQPSFGNVVFGYMASSGSFFSVILPDGTIKSLGYNANGQLGNGGFANSLTPSAFILPGGQKAAVGFSNFLSEGNHLFVVTADGSLYGAGANNVGQLGNGSTATAVATPVKFNLPNGRKAAFVSSAGPRTFVLDDTGNIYGSGSCDYGQLGTGASCSTTSNPTRVALPTVNVNNQNTIPDPDPNGVQPRNLVTDFYTAYVRMKGGDVWAWGNNNQGQFGNGTTTNSSTPVKLTMSSTTATPIFTQVATDGIVTYLIDDAGRAWSSGARYIGQGGILSNDGAVGSCMQKDPTPTVYIRYVACNGNDGWQFMEFWPDKTWRFRTDSGTYDPTSSMLCATAPAAVSNFIQMLPCTGATNQQWNFNQDKLIRPQTNSSWCVRTTGSYLSVEACSGANAYERWTTQSMYYNRPIPRPPGNPAYVKMTTDNGSIHLLDANGDVWSAGSNNRGQLCTGAAVNTHNPVLKQAVFSGLPAGVKVVDLYNTSSDPNGSSGGINTGSAMNDTFFVMSDGSVYGCGANNYGQLGIGTTGDYVNVAQKMNLPPGTLVKSVQSGYGTTVVLTTTGQVFTVGNNSNGQLGDGTTTNSSTPRANRYTNQQQSIIY